MKAFDIFSSFSSLKPNKSKCKVAEIGALKGVKMTLCGMKCTDLRINTVKILGIHFSYNKNSENDENFLKHITGIAKVLKLWRMRNLTLEGKVIVFKALTISKIVHVALITNIPKSKMKELKKIKNELIWKNKNPKIKHITLCDSYDNGDLNNIHISSKITSLQCSWIKKLYDKTTPSWKVIPLHLIKTNLGINFKFHSNLDISVQKLKIFPNYCKTIFKNWCLHLTSTPALPSAISSQVLWYNKNIKIDNRSIYLAQFSKKDLNCCGHLFNERQKLKTWDELQQEYRFLENKRSLFMQLLHAIPKSWKEG